MLFDLIKGNLGFGEALMQIAAILMIVFLVLPFHEWAHSMTAKLLGDVSQNTNGRLTLNPLAHIDIFGALCLLLFNFGWAKPVPIDTRNFKHPKTYMAITALMGPVANVIAAIVGALIYYGVIAIAGETVAFMGFWTYFSYFISVYVQINCYLAAFNILPVPPLDGSKVLFSFLPDKWIYFIQRYSMYYFIIIYLLLFTGILSVPITFIANGLLNFVYLVARLPFSAFLPI